MQKCIMMSHPDDYIGKQITMEGQFIIYEDETTGDIYGMLIMMLRHVAPGMELY